MFLFSFRFVCCFVFVGLGGPGGGFGAPGGGFFNLSSSSGLPLLLLPLKPPLGPPKPPPGHPISKITTLSRLFRVLPLAVPFVLLNRLLGLFWLQVWR